MHGTIDIICWIAFVGCLIRSLMAHGEKESKDWAINAVICLVIAVLIAVTA